MVNPEKISVSIFEFLNKTLYRHCFYLYSKLYFIYKDITHRRTNALLKNAVKPGMTVLDIGANVGYYSVYLSKLVGKSGKVYAFEPDELNYSYLKINTGNRNNIIVNNVAVGEKSGWILLYQSERLNVDHQTYDSGEGRQTKKIQCVAIDDYFTNGELVDIVKLDIQGYDYFAVKGMRRVLERSPDVMIFGEFWPYGLKRAGVSPLDYTSLLKDLGFKVELEDGITIEDCLHKSDDKYFYTGFVAYKKASKIVDLC